jgi:hypothetical protein
MWAGFIWFTVKTGGGGLVNAATNFIFIEDMQFPFTKRANK